MDRTEATNRGQEFVDAAVQAAQAAAPALEFGPIEASTSDCFGTLGKQTDQINVVLDRSAVVADTTSLVAAMDAVEAVWRDQGIDIDRREASARFPGPSMFGQIDGFDLQASYIVETATRPLSVFVGVASPCVDP